MQAVAAGDGRALQELCHRYERPLYQFLFRHTGGRDVDDLYQDTWLRVVRAAGRFDARRRFSTWLFQIAINLARDWRRRPPPEPVESAALERASEAATLDGRPSGRGPHGSELAGGAAAATEAAIDARRLLAALPEAQRSVVILRYYHDLGEDEMAAVLGCPRGTVKSRLHHAMRRLVELARR